MAVIINEIEVTVAEPRAQRGAADQPPQAGAAQPQAGGKMSPQDLADVWRHQAQRLARVRAH